MPERMRSTVCDLRCFLHKSGFLCKSGICECRFRSRAIPEGVGFAAASLFLQLTVGARRASRGEDRTRKFEGFTCDGRRLNKTSY